MLISFGLNCRLLFFIPVQSQKLEHNTTRELPLVVNMGKWCEEVVTSLENTTQRSKSRKEAGGGYYTCPAMRGRMHNNKR